MKMRTCALVAVVAGLCLGLSGPGQVGSALAQPGDNGEQEGLESGLYNIYFDGGTLGEYFDLVADETGTNIVAGNDVRSLAMPPVRLRRVLPDTAVHVVQAMFHDPGRQTVELEYINSGEEVSTFVANLRQDGPPAGSNVVNDVFSVGDVLRPADEEPVDAQVQRIFEMIDSAMRLTTGVEGGSEPELAFHDETQMLVFRGTPEQQRMVESVLVRYTQSWSGPSERIRVLRNEIASLELAAREEEIDARLALQRLEIARTELNEFEALVDSGSMSSRELAQARLRASEVEAEHQVAQAREEAMRARLEQFKAELNSLTGGQGSTAVVYDFRPTGLKGEHVGQLFQAMLEAAAIPGTEITPDGSGDVTLRAAPPLHEALRYLLGEIGRQGAAAGGTR